MDKIVRIPVRVQSSAGDRPESVENRAGGVPAGPHREEPRLPVQESPAQAEPAEADIRPVREPKVEKRRERDEEGEWRDLALRLQAEMDNYRKRQQRLAQEEIEAERLRLLRSFLPIVDNLERALAAPAGDAPGLRQGVELTHRELLKRLQQEGVERIQALNRRFDPNWHEAVSAIPHDGRGSAPGTVVEVLEPGYRVGDRLLRPARVIVAI